MTAHPAFDVRDRWSNHLGNQSVDPLRVYRPASIDEVAAIVDEARRTGVTARAVGSGHSWSDVALTTGFVLDTRLLSEVPSSEPDFLRRGWEGRPLVRAGAGIRIRELNAWLDDHGLALSNMGGYDHQTVAGVISTSTHGSGITFGPLNDFVRSLDLVAGDGRVHRVEPADGPTDPAAYEAHHGERRLLHQSDDWFRAVAVGMGSIGVVCTAMLEVEPRYFLREVRTFHTWDKVRADLEDGEVLRRNRHYEVLFSPYRRKHAYPCLVTTRNRTESPANKWWDKRTRNWAVELASAFPLTPHLINLVVDLRPSLSPFLLENAIRALVKDEYDEVSYKVLNIGAANVLPAYSAEIGVPMDGRHLEAVDRIITVAAERRTLGEAYQSSPISFRFVKGSDAHLSMMHGRDTMMIELIQLTRCDGGYELLAAYEEALADLEARPHWGQVNALTGSHDQVAGLYPRYADWLAVRRELDPEGVFDSPFTRRVGISGRPALTPAPR
jgi:FAD/FMN-containing dehydrogenase